MELVFYTEGCPQTVDSRRSFPGRSVLKGQLKGYYDIEVRDRLTLFSISFKPYGVRMFFDFHIGELYDTNISLQQLVGDESEMLEEEIHRARSFAERVAAVERFLLKRLSRCTREYEVRRMAHSLSLVGVGNGAVGVNDLADAACLSRKQLERDFSAYVGASPKQFLKTIRFQRSLYEKYKKNELSLTELAFASGYYDQSHMINDYKQLSGRTPSEFFDECEPYSDFFL